MDLTFYLILQKEADRNCPVDLISVTGADQDVRVHITAPCRMIVTTRKRLPLLSFFFEDFIFELWGAVNERRAGVGL